VNIIQIHRVGPIVEEFEPIGVITVLIGQTRAVAGNKFGDRDALGCGGLAGESNAKHLKDEGEGFASSKYVAEDTED